MDNLINLFSLGILLLSFPGCSDNAPQNNEQSHPNIILIVSDDQGYNDLGVANSIDIK